MKPNVREPKASNPTDAGSGTAVTDERLNPIASRARRSRFETTPSSPEANVGSMMPIPRLSFQWLACCPSPKFFPSDQALSDTAVAPPSNEKYFARLSAVQVSSGGLTCSGESREIKRTHISKQVVGERPIHRWRIYTPLTNPRACPISWMATPTKSNVPPVIPFVRSKSKLKKLLNVIDASARDVLSDKRPRALAVALYVRT